MSVERRRLRKLHNTVAASLTTDHIDSLELLELLRQNPPRVIYDIGANVGTWTLLAKAVFPNAEIHAFEPLPRLKQNFLGHTRGLTGVHLHQIGLGAKAEMMPMRLADFIDASSLLEMTTASSRHFHVHPAGEEMIRVERLDEYVAKMSLPPPDLLKLDIQGYELEALRGASKTLEASTAVLSEVSFIELYRGQCLFHDVVSFLATKDFSVRAFPVRTALGVRLLQCDVLFERSFPGDAKGVVIGSSDRTNKSPK